jgi:hypothetical protein
MITADYFPARSKSFLSMTMGTEIPLSKATTQKCSAIQISRTALRPAIPVTVLKPVTTTHACPLPIVEQSPNATAAIAPKTVRFSNELAILCNFDPEDTSNLVRVDYTRDTYGQLREADVRASGRELSHVQVGYGTIDYRIDLSASQTIKV